MTQQTTPKPKHGDVYRGEDQILESIRRIWMNGDMTWNRSCTFVADNFDNEDLSTSATYARSQQITGGNMGDLYYTQEMAK